MIHLHYRLGDAAKQLPAELLAYHSLVPLQEDVSKSTKIFGYPSHIYKATSSLDGIAYALRRIAGYHLRDQRAMGVVEAWRSLRHPGVVALHEAFSTKAFGDESVVFVCDYFPRSRTLLAQHFVPSSPAADSSGDVTAATAAASNGTLRGRSQSKGASQRGGSTSTSQPPVTATIVPVTEAVLWSYIVQLVSAVKAIHDAGMACRILEPSKILITGKHR